ncbi:hypothetical protein MTO96_018223 [Rhipicephalus appendiculatus]
MKLLLVVVVFCVAISVAHAILGKAISFGAGVLAGKALSRGGGGGGAYPYPYAGGHGGGYGGGFGGGYGGGYGFSG